MKPTPEQIVAALDTYDESLAGQERPTLGARFLAMQAALEAVTNMIEVKP